MFFDKVLTYEFQANVCSALWKDEVLKSLLSVGLSLHASPISSLIVADWPLYYIIQNFKRFFVSPEISLAQMDKIFVSLPYVYKCTVYHSILKTKHCGVLLADTDDPLPAPSCKRKVQLFDLRAHNIDRLRYNIFIFPWDRLLMCSDVDYLYEQFVNIVHSIIL